MTPEAATDARTLTRHLGQGEDLYRRARAHVERLQGIGHPGVCAPVAVDHRDDGQVVAESPALDGTDLGELTRVRGALNLGECLTVGIGVANALSALHAQGLTHGDISAGNVMIVDGEVLLVDVWGDVLTHEHGTAPYADPARADAGPSAPGDIHALGVLLRECVNTEGQERLAAWASPMLTQDPSARPSASMVERALPACATPTEIEVPTVGVASAMRARAQGPHHLTTRLDSGRSWRAWKRVRRALAIGGIAVLAVATVAAGVQVLTVTAPMVLPAQPRPPQYLRAVGAPAVAAAALTTARFEALAEADAASLVATTLPDSPAHEQALQEAGAIEDGSVEFEGLAVAVDDVETVASTASGATVFVDYEVSAHQVRHDDEVVTYEAYTQRVELDLTWRNRTWLVRQVQPLPSPTGPPR